MTPRTALVSALLALAPVGAAAQQDNTAFPTTGCTTFQVSSSGVWTASQDLTLYGQNTTIPLHAGDPVPRGAVAVGNADFVDVLSQNCPGISAQTP